MVGGQVKLWFVEDNPPPASCATMIQLHVLKCGRNASVQGIGYVATAISIYASSSVYLFVLLRQINSASVNIENLYLI